MKKQIIRYLMCLSICLCAIGLAPKKSAQAACSHKWGSYVTTKSATCTASGSKKRTCSKCGATETATISALGHNYAAATCTSAKKCTRCGTTSGNSLGHNYAAATCTAAKKCTRCGATSGSALGHNWGSWVTEESATCTQAGAKHRVCSRCSKMEQAKIDALGHNYSAATCTAAQKCKRCGATNGSALGHNYSAATCTAAKKCTRCGATSGNALGHNWGSWTTDKAATCTASGSRHRSCTRCGSTESATIAALGHNYSTATCTAASKCSRCGTTNGSALGHNWGSWVTEEAATCTVAGAKHRVCSRCSKMEQAKIDALGHNYADATCTSAKKCKRCGATTGSSLGHNWGSWVTEEAATCTAAGAKHRVCSRCNKMEQAKIDALGHNYADATCTSAKKCKRCGATSGSALGHSWSSWITDKAATCTVSGSRYRSCSRCGKTESEIIAAPGHDYAAATCTLAKKCKRCGATSGDALGHNWGSWVTEEEARCTEAGAKHRVCSRCNKMEQAKIEPLGHNWGEYQITQPVNCKQDGYETRYCKRTGCGASERRKYADKTTTHTWGNWEIEDPATCTQPGAEHRVCSVCKKMEQAKIEPLDHNWGDYQITQKASCKQDGIETRKCARCGATQQRVYKTKEEIPHTWGNWEIEDPATCTQPGAEHRVCSVCKKMEQRKIEIPGHDWGDYQITQKASCKQDGIETRKCARCGATQQRVYKTKEEIPHTWGNWVEEDPATCTQPGAEHRVCTVCKKMEQREIEIPGHNWGDYQITQKASCKQDGIETRKCARCGATQQRVYKTKEEIPHTWGNWVEEDPATCTQPGAEHHVCSVCQKMEQRKIEPTGHKWGSDVIIKEAGCEDGIMKHACLNPFCGKVETYIYQIGNGHRWGNWVEEDPATCTQPGAEHRVCAACQKMEQRKIEAYGHNWGPDTVVSEVSDYTDGVYAHTCRRCNVTEKYVYAAKTGIDITTDSNNDGISDYFTQMIAEGKITLSDGSNPFGEGVTYERIQANSDFDGDGLRNGDEIKVNRISDHGYKIIMYSDPANPDTDGDGYYDNVDSRRMLWDVGDRDLAIFAALAYENGSNYIGSMYTAGSIVGSHDPKDDGERYYFWDYASLGDQDIAIAKRWEIVDYVNEWSSLFDKFSATTFKCDDNIVIAYRGTGDDNETEITEWIDNIVAYGLLNHHTEESHARAYARRIAAMYPGYKIYITGHSLGGYLAQIGAAELLENTNTVPEKVAYFNGIGMNFYDHTPLSYFLRLVADIELENTVASETYYTNLILHENDISYLKNYANGHSCISYQIAGDVVSSLGSHCGTKISYYATADCCTRRQATGGTQTSVPFILKRIEEIAGTSLEGFYRHYNPDGFMNYMWITHETDSFYYYLWQGDRNPNKKAN